MDRRDFFKAGAQAAAAGTSISIPACSSQAADAPNAGTTASVSGTSVFMKDFSAEDHRRRLQNIGVCTRRFASACASTW